MTARQHHARRAGWSRRDFLHALGAGTAAGVAPAALQAAERPDVVIVGAGAAGIAAARRLQREGLTVRVLEAAKRPGGRAFTESGSLGVPFDHGASWITSADDNPHMSLAERHGFDLVAYADAPETLYVQGQEAGSEAYAQYYAAFDAINENIRAASWSGQDRPASDVVPDVPFAATAQTWLGPLDMGVDFDELSTVDYWSGAATAPMHLVRRGYGGLVKRLAADLPITMDAPVTRIDWSGPGVRVHSTRGVSDARACIVTVSTGVLNAGGIAFEPALPDWKQQAIHDLPMGLLAKVALRFEGTRFGLAEDSWLTYQVDHPLPAEACFFNCWPAGSDLMIGFVGGDFGFELSRAGSEAAIDFARAALRARLGGEVDRRFVRGTFTDWANDPLTQGGYAAARPARAEARDDIGDPVGERVFFAGEACAGPYAATCGGAHRSGEATARRLARALA